MKNILYLFLFIIITLVGCSKDEDGSITFDDEYLFLEEYGESAVIYFTNQNLTDLEVKAAPDGWEIEITSSESVMITAPAEDDADAELVGSLYISGTAPNESTAYDNITIAMVNKIELDDPDNDQQANCMVVTEPNTIYSFNPNRRGENTTEMSEKADDCKILWRTAGIPINNIDMTNDGRVQFYVCANLYDDLNIIEGNAIIAAVDSSDNILWSWHIWITDEPVTDVDVAGMKFLDRNIGAFMNDNTSADNILDSYGLYYQWGRKDPFIYPLTYNAQSSNDAYMFNEEGKAINVELKDSNPGYGALLYTQFNPEAFILGNEESRYDWLYEQNDNLWGSNGEKSIYDPSPKGYRVPTSAEYSLLTLDESESLNLESYGRKVDDELFMAYGVRTYLDYTIQNYKSDGSYARWAGYYWSSDSNGSKSEALYFDIDNKIEVTTAYRATGMQIRPIKME